MKYKKEIKKMIPWMLLSFCIYFLIQIAAIVPSYVMSYIIDVVVPNGNIQKIILYILLFVLIPLVMGVGNSFYTYIMAIQCRIRSYDFNRRILSKLLCQNMTYLTVHSGGELSAKAMQEVRVSLALYNSAGSSRYLRQRDYSACYREHPPRNRIWATDFYPPDYCSDKIQWENRKKEFQADV